MHTVFVRIPNRRGYTQCYTNVYNYRYVRQQVTSFFAGTNDYLLYYNGKELVEGEDVPSGSILYVSFSLPGGKGGFGSMLRAIGAQIEKTTNREACRDLSGRRLRDINEEQRLKKWISKKAEREAEKARRRKERIERLKSKPKHNFFDFDYEKKISELPERIDEALNEGIQKAKKRPLEPIEPTTTKKKRLWLEEDISGSSEDSSDNDFEKFSLESRLSGNAEKRGEAGSSKAFEPVESESCESSSSSNSVSFLVKATSDEGKERCEMTSEVDENGVVDSSKLNSSESNKETPISIDSKSENENINQSDKETPVSLSSKCQSEKNNQSENKSDSLDNSSVPKDENPEIPIQLDDFHDTSELEDLGLERLKFALVARGLKCGGTLSDRVQRLWAVKGLKPSEYPKNLLAKQKK